MQRKNTEPVRTDVSIADIITQFLKAMAEAFAPTSNEVSIARLMRYEDERSASAEATIQSRYANAWYRRHELRQRAAAHGVAFSSSASYEHQAAILDFLDDPHRPSPLTWGHTT